MTINFVNLRNKLIEQEVLVRKGEANEFADDFIFSSPSTAASIVLARNANGLTEWKLKSGMTLKEFETKNK